MSLFYWNLTKKENSLHYIIDYAQNVYSIIISEQNIIEITSHETDKFHTNPIGDTVNISLTEKRRLSLSEKVKDKTIDFFINEFQKEFESFKNVNEIIGNFLYELFCTNIESFQKLLDNKKEIKSLINLDSSAYSEKEKEIINNFLHWDNPEKDKAIFNISSYALEYCMLTNRNGGGKIFN